MPTTRNGQARTKIMHDDIFELLNNIADRCLYAAVGCLVGLHALGLYLVWDIARQLFFK